jgi:hypothetical protein
LAERNLEINEVNINGFRTREVFVRPGAALVGAVTVTTSSSSLFRTHTGVWLPSWDRRAEALRVFSNSVGGTERTIVDISLAAPVAPGIYYLLFCFDRKHANEMYTELTQRTDEQIYANGRAIRITIDPNAAEPPRPNSRERAFDLPLDGASRSGTAGNGADRESWWKISTARLNSARNDAVKVRVQGDRPEIDLDFEILDSLGRRRGYSEAEGSGAESSVIRVQPNETLYVRVFAFRAGDEAGYRIRSEPVGLPASIVDPSAGRSLTVGDGYGAQGRAREGTAGSAWYRLPLLEDGSIDVEVKGSSPSRDLDLWIYDDLGNVRASSKSEGSALERARVDFAESGVYYARVGAYRRTDESDFSISVRGRGLVANGAVVTTPATPSTPGPTPTLDSGLRFPVSYEVSRGKDDEGFIRVTNEPSFLIEVFTGWGDIGKIDSIKVFAPDGALLWSKTAEGKGWEAERITTRGPGFYRIVISNSAEEIRRGRLDVQGLADPHIYPPRRGGAVDAGGGAGLDAAEREQLQTLYQMFLRRGEGVSNEESDLLRRMEDYFLKN